MPPHSLIDNSLGILPDSIRAENALVETIVRDPLFELDFAIKNKDEAKFAEYYGH